MGLWEKDCSCSWNCVKITYFLIFGTPIYRWMNTFFGRGIYRPSYTWKHSKLYLLLCRKKKFHLFRDKIYVRSIVPLFKVHLCFILLIPRPGLKNFSYRCSLRLVQISDDNISWVVTCRSADWEGVGRDLIMEEIWGFWVLNYCGGQGVVTSKSDLEGFLQ